MKKTDSARQLNPDALYNLSIDQVDERLRAWASGILKQVEISSGPPDGSRGVHLYLYQLSPVPALRGAARSPLQLRLCYLVTAHSDNPAQAHRWLSDLVFGAMANPDIEVLLEPLPLETWTAFGVIPQPAFLLCLPLRQDDARPEAPPVRHPLVIKDAPLLLLYGQVVGPGDTPLPDLRVEMPSAGLTAYTDADGRFQFAYVPANGEAAQLRVTGKGRALEVTIDRAAVTSASKPFVIRFLSVE